MAYCFSRNTELWHYDPPPQLPTPPGPPPPLTNCDPHQSLCAALDWSLPHPALPVNYLFWQSDKRLFFFCTTHICTVFVLFNWFALYLPCALCHFIYLSFILFFLQCPHLYICIVCMYIWLNCIYLYLNIYCQCLMLTVCTKGLRVTQFQFSVCMCCTCGRIDNKADLTWLTWLLHVHCLKKTYNKNKIVLGQMIHLNKQVCYESKCSQ